jgi:hypothetical protein
MSRLANAILQQGSAFSAGKNSPMVDLQFGGQMGYSPELAEWVSNQNYIRRNVIPLLVEAPKGFQMLPNSQSWVSTLRALVELHAMSVEGLQAGLTVDITSTPVGGGGQMQDDFIDVKQTQSKVTFKWNEKYGMPVFNFFNGWIRNLMMDPDTKYAAISTISGTKPTDMLADMYAMTCLFIEPDPSHTKVVKAWLGTNMFPQGTGEVVGRRDLTSASEPTTYDIEFTGIYQFGTGVDAFAQQMLSAINITGANPYNRQAFVNTITADVLAATKSYQASVQDVGSQQARV